MLVAPDACAWPVLTRLAPDRLGLVHFDRPSHGLEEGDLVARVSDDEGRSWQPAGIAAPHDPGANRMHLASGVDHAGNWLVLSTGFQVAGGKFIALEAPWLSRAGPGCRHWEIIRDCTFPRTDARPIPHGRILALPDGRLAATLYRSQGRGHPSRAWVVFSRDHGRTWAEATLIDGADANEVVLLRRADGRLLAAARTHVDHHVVLHRSDDDGATWRRAGDLTLPMQHPADLTDLGARGVLLTYGIRNRGLMGVGARLSRDGGGTWSAPVVLYHFGDASDGGYPSTVATAEGALLTACYADHSPLHHGYHLLTLRWELEEFFTPRDLRALSDGAPLRL